MAPVVTSLTSRVDYVHYILIIIKCQVYIVLLNVLYDDVYIYKSLQINFLFCSVLSLLLTAVGATAELTPSIISVYIYFIQCITLTSAGRHACYQGRK